MARIAAPSRSVQGARFASALIDLMVRQEDMEVFRSAFVKPHLSRQRNKVAPSYGSARGRQDGGAGSLSPHGKARVRQQEWAAPPDAMPCMDDGAVTKIDKMLA